MPFPFLISTQTHMILIISETKLDCFKEGVNRSSSCYFSYIFVSTLTKVRLDFVGGKKLRLCCRVTEKYIFYSKQCAPYNL
ncbi:unnamed protein product [Pieris brassicae]|uniref:Uncharacterized protein n=1 Tax=Pieris brassicae TaxID=7116 RepID=A0A9P0TYB7_PIEBR|nr:unnamed protein product [Pieris brassicae]